MKKKRLVSIFIVVVLLLTFIPTLALAQGEIFGTPREYMRISFLNALDRGGDDQTINDYTNLALSHGAEVALYNILFSPEFTSKDYDNSTYVEYLYKTILHRGSDPEGKALWVGLLNSGTSRDEVFRGIVHSQEAKYIIEGHSLNV